MKKQRTSGRTPIKDRICLGVYITADMHDRLVGLAEERELTLSDIVRMALKDYLAKNEQ